METLPCREHDEVPDVLIGVRGVIPGTKPPDALCITAVDQTHSEAVQQRSAWTRKNLSKGPVRRQQQVFIEVAVFQSAVDPLLAGSLPPPEVGVDRNAALIEVVARQSKPADKRGPFAEKEPANSGLTRTTRPAQDEQHSRIIYAPGSSMAHARAASLLIPE